MRYERFPGSRGTAVDKSNRFQRVRVCGWRTKEATIAGGDRKVKREIQRQPKDHCWL